MIRALKALLAVALMLTLAACDPTKDLQEPPAAELGPFRLGHNIVIARNPTVGPGSRTATEAEWQAAMTKAIDDRFGRYEGDRLYHLGISVDGYILALLDVPLVPSPKSVLIVTASVWDDAKGMKLNKKAEQITVLGGLLSGTGVQPSKDEQLANLSASAAKAIEKWLKENPQWFDVSDTPVADAN